MEGPEGLSLKEITAPVISHHPNVCPPSWAIVREQVLMGQCSGLLLLLWGGPAEGKKSVFKLVT